MAVITTGSFLGLRGVFLSVHLPVKTQIASVDIIAYTLAAQSHGFPSPLPLNLAVYPRFSLLFVLRGRGFVPAPAGWRPVVFYCYHYPSCNSVARYPLLPYR